MSFVRFFGIGKYFVNELWIVFSVSYNFEFYSFFCKFKFYCEVNNLRKFCEWNKFVEGVKIEFNKLFIVDNIKWF